MDYLQHREEREALRQAGIGADTVAQQRRVNGSRYLSVRDWGELDGFQFRSRTTRPLAEILLSLFAFKKVKSFGGSHARIAEMLGAFGHPCSPGTVRNAIAELRALGLASLSMCEYHPEGFRCRADRIDMEMRQICENPEAAPIYVLSGTLALMVGALAMRCARGVERKRKTASSRLPTNDNLPRAFASTKQKNSSRSVRRRSIRPHAPSAKADSAKDRPSAGSSKIQRRLNGAQTELTGKGGGESPSSPNVASKPARSSAVRRFEPPSIRRIRRAPAVPTANHEAADPELQIRRARALRALIDGSISAEEFSAAADLPLPQATPPTRAAVICGASPSPKPEPRSGLSELNRLTARITSLSSEHPPTRRDLTQAVVARILELLRADEISFAEALRLLRVEERRCELRKVDDN